MIISVITYVASSFHINHHDLFDSVNYNFQMEIIKLMLAIILTCKKSHMPWIQINKCFVQD